MALSPKRVLVVANDTTLRTTRVTILEKAGFTVASVLRDDDAMKMLETEQFDLVLIGKSDAPDNLDQRLRKRYPDLLILKIVPKDESTGVHSSRTTDSNPENVVQTLKAMLD
jgi:CheY-like chemotaxis protein